MPKSDNRPYVIYSVASSIDGRTATYSGDTELSDEQDWKDVHALRKSVDAIMVGINTILKDDSRLTVQFFPDLKEFPKRIVIDSKLRISSDAKVIQYESQRYSTLIATVKSLELTYLDRKSALNKTGVEILECGSGNQVDLIVLMKGLKLCLESRVPSPEFRVPSPESRVRKNAN